MNNTKYINYLFEYIKKMTFGNPGVIRETYGKGENLAHKFLIKELRKFTKNIVIDYGGNFIASSEGKSSNKTIIIGSHLDSQKHGGNFDGLAGVIMGVCLLKKFKETNFVPKYNVAVMGIRGEESCWFPYSYIGSKMALGCFDKKLLKDLVRSDTGKSLQFHLDECGFDSKGVSQNKTKINPKNIIAFIEPHIEQGPVLEKNKISLGVVTGIRGSFRFRSAKCVGKYLHSGATPIDYRQDSVLATSMLVSEMNNFWKKELKNNKDLTITFGEFFTDKEEHSFAKSSGLVTFCLDVRSNSKVMLKKTKNILLRNIQIIESKTKTKFNLGKETGSDPAMMSKKLIKKFQFSAKKNKIKSLVMASGAGHDASVFANNNIPSIMLFIRNQHGSHNPMENMHINHFKDVFKVLEDSIKNF
jgi:N-carbamoyl-L-amino-acid hydrolase